MKLSDLALATSENIFERKLDKEGTLIGDHFLMNEEVSAFLVYTTLKDLFGEPNMRLMNPDAIQWQYEFIYNNFSIRVGDWQGASWMMSCYTKIGSDSKDAKKTSESIEKSIVNATNKFKKREDEELKHRKERFIENPFRTYYDAALALVDEAGKIDPAKAENIDESNASSNTISALCKAAFTSFLSSFEGRLNLLYEIYLNKSLREVRISDKIGREQIDIKFRLAPFYCEGFSVKTLDSSDQRFKNFLKIVNLRNDFIHANITDAMQQAIVRDGEFTFILHKKHTGELPNNINQLNIEHIKLTKKYIDDAIDLLIENMETRMEREFSRILSERHI